MIALEHYMSAMLRDSPIVMNSPDAVTLQCPGLASRFFAGEPLACGGPK